MPSVLRIYFLAKVQIFTIFICKNPPNQDSEFLYRSTLALLKITMKQTKVIKSNQINKHSVCDLILNVQ